MNLKGLMFGVLLFIWTIVCWYWYVCGIKNLCNSCQTADLTTQEISPEDTLLKAPLTYVWNSELSYIENEYWPILDSIFHSIDSKSALVLVGTYYPLEENNTPYEDLGLARAMNLKMQLASQIDTHNIQVKSKVMDMDTATQLYFEAMNYEVIAKPIVDISSNLENENTSDEKMNMIEENSDGAIIHYESNYSKSMVNRTVENYLTRFANSIRGINIRTTIVGHTDDNGSSNEIENTKRSINRANEIKRILVSKGLDESLIDVEGMGSSDPIASNNTDYGKMKNRRVEIKISKQ